jgi:hypothetical protein
MNLKTKEEQKMKLYKLLVIAAAGYLLVGVLGGVTSANATGDWVAGYITPGTRGGARLEFNFDLDETRQVLMYGLGPSVAERGLKRNVVTDPRIRIFSRNADESLTLVGRNRDWQDAENADDIAAALRVLGATLHDVEAAVLATLAPGRYVVRVRSEDRSAGHVVAGATAYDGGAPPLPGPDDVEPGEWSGSAANYTACVFVSLDGTSLAYRGSSCDDIGYALLISVTNMVGNCTFNAAEVDLARESVVDIVNNSFSYEKVWHSGFWGTLVVEVRGTFSGDVLTGTVTRRVDALEQSCTGEFMATPVQ